MVSKGIEKGTFYDTIVIVLKRLYFQLIIDE